MITLSIILSIVWIVLTAQALYLRIKHHRQGPYCNGYYPKCSSWNLGISEFQFYMPEMTCCFIVIAICSAIVKFLP